jgi:hypothetical protein
LEKYRATNGVGMVNSGSRLLTHIDATPPVSRHVHLSIVSAHVESNGDGYGNGMMVNNSWNDECHSLSRSSTIVIAWNGFSDDDSLVDDSTYQWSLSITNNHNNLYVHTWSYISNTSGIPIVMNNKTLLVAPVLSYSKSISSSSSSSFDTWRMRINLSHIQWFIDSMMDNQCSQSSNISTSVVQMRVMIRTMNNAGLWSDPSSSNGTILIGSMTSSSSSCTPRVISVCN